MFDRRFFMRATKLDFIYSRDMGNGFRIIVDGYNLIFQCGLEGRSRTPIALEKARQRLISTLASQLDAELGSRTAIVFDAERLPIKETEAVSQVSGITVIYAVDHEDADSLIEELIAKNSVPKRLVVVSSDHRLHKAALRRKSKPIDSDIWYDRLLLEKSNSLPAPDPDSKDGIDELKSIDWASKFRVDENSTARPTTINPFPPGYADDVLGDDEST